MAATLLAVNGVENALEFVYALQAHGLTLVSRGAVVEGAQPPLEM